MGPNEFSLIYLGEKTNICVINLPYAIRVLPHFLSKIVEVFGHNMPICLVETRLEAIEAWSFPSFHWEQSIVNFIMLNRSDQYESKLTIQLGETITHIGPCNMVFNPCWRIFSSWNRSMRIGTALVEFLLDPLLSQASYTSWPEPYHPWR